MAEIETLGILDEILPIVSDKLQVVSYKWLSRNFLVSSNAAKRLLQEFVDKYGNGLEVIYSLSGWLKNDPSTYLIKLVTKNKLSVAKQEFDGKCSIQVYSVQACLPKDPVTLWNQEFVQAEDLFKQPVAVNNCLRDNRFCGVSNSFVKRTAGESTLGLGNLQLKTTGVSGLSKSSSFHPPTAVPQPQQKKFQQSSPNTGVQSHDTAKITKTETHVKLDQEQGAQIAADKEKVPQSLPDKKRGQSDKSSSGTGGVLASMWGRASAKSKPDALLAHANNTRQNSAASSEAQISAHETVECGSSDEDGQDFNIKRTNGEGNRKRRVVFDYSDEDEECQDAVNLSSPDPPKGSTPCLKDTSRASGLDCNLSFEERENKPKVSEVNGHGLKPKQHLGEEVSAKSRGNRAESPTSDKTISHAPEIDDGMKDKVADAVTKRRKVLKTRIDERGREVTEVICEGEEPDAKSDSNSVKIAENNTVQNAVNRPPVARKSPAVGNSASANPAGKAGNKKAGNKDPKQGNLLSFFKKA